MSTTSGSTQEPKRTDRQVMPEPDYIPDLDTSWMSDEEYFRRFMPMWFVDHAMGPGAPDSGNTTTPDGIIRSDGALAA